MAFCNSCGTSLAPGAKFCNKCGATVAASASVPATTPATPIPSTGAAAPATQQGQGSSALKILLIVVAVILGLGVLGLGTVGFVAWRIAKSSHMRHQGDSVKVETPFGTVESSKDPEEAARNLGIDIYPGAQVLKEGSATATFGGVHTVTANFETSDSVDKVASFYKSKFPNAMVTDSQAGTCTILSSDSKNLVTININADGDKTKIHISNVSHKSGTSNSSSN
jgi:zinc-ribbon domain